MARNTEPPPVRADERMREAAGVLAVGIRRRGRRQMSESETVRSGSTGGATCRIGQTKEDHR